MYMSTPAWIVAEISWLINSNGRFQFALLLKTPFFHHVSKMQSGCYFLNLRKIWLLQDGSMVDILLLIYWYMFDNKAIKIMDVKKLPINI